MHPISRAMRGRDLWIVVGLIALAVGLPAVVGIASGAISIPHNDDFAYRRAALTLYETGRFEFTGWAVMTLVGQLAATMPLLWLAGGGAWAFAATGAIFATIGIVASYALARRVLSPGRAGFAVLLAILVPGFMLYTTAYMTEVPAFAMEVSCLAIGAAGLDRSSDGDRWRWLAASVAVGCYAFSIREYAIAAPLAVLAAAAASDRRGRRLPYGLGLVAVVVACGAIYRFTAGFPGQGTVGLALPTPATTRRVLDATAVLTFALGPAILIAARSWIPFWWRSRHQLGVVLGALAGLAAASVVYADQLAARIVGAADGAPDLFVGNVFQSHGSLDVGPLAGSRPMLYVAPTWDLLNDLGLLATFGAFALLGATLVAERHRILRAIDIRTVPAPLGSVSGMLAVFVVLFGGGTIALGLTAILFDRYTWPLALPLAILLLRRPAPAPAPVTKRRAMGFATPFGPEARRSAFQAMTGALFVLVATTSLVLLLNEAAFESARWRLGEDAVRLGFAAETVDAGFEWVGLHATGLVDLTARRVPFMTDYSVKFPSFRACALASSSRLDFPAINLLVTRTDAYRLLLFVGPSEPLYLYRVARPGCPAGS